MVLPSNFNPNKHTIDVIRQGHNRALNRFFLDIPQDDRLTSNRAHIKTALRIRDGDSAIQVLNKQLYFQQLQKQISDENAIATTPEWWAVRVGSDRPQLIVVFRPPGGKSSYQLSIPHYEGGKQPTIPAYRKGGIRGEITLTDNSKLVVNAASEAEAERVLKVLMRYVSSRYLKNREIKITKLRRAFKEIRVVPLFADFYSKGQESIRPDWRTYLRG
jgi:hypothetical protein